MTGPAPSPRNAASADASATPKRRHIILFSDGTGNSSAKLFKTNVWRLYEALDLGPAAPDRERQIAFYDNGVGTSSFRPLAVLGGVFGFGLKRNILDIYRFACRNYRPGADGQEGDYLYGFGFSRGAFTIRLVIALIASQGLVRSTDEAELLRLSEDAYRCFRRDFLPRHFPWPTKAFRAVRDFAIRSWRTRRGIALYDSAKNERPVLRFVGVWDTVAAYGGPSTEIVRAIDNWFYALSMPDYKLSPKVRNAAHALAIDDERDAFHPLVWDELHEEEQEGDGVIAPDRLKQVWFAGMHADVGGGYPDESLSYVSLLWMIDEAHACGLRTLEPITDRYRALANSAGPIHDSRAGIGGYYRYQPRKLAALMTPADAGTPHQHDPRPFDERALIDGVDPGSLYQRDPGNDVKGRPRGYLRDVLIHESVAARIADGTDRYAPITLPARFRIAPLERGGETAPQPDDIAPDTPSGTAQPTPPLISAALRRRFEDPERGDARVAAMEKVWDLVWRRRIVYFATLLTTALFVLLPAWVHRAPDPPVLADGRTWLGEIVRAVGTILPAFLHGWITVAAAHSFYVLVLGVLILVLLRTASALELRLRDHNRAIWRHALHPAADGEGSPPPPAARLRTAPGYQRFMRAMKWIVLPVVIAAAMFVAGLWLVASLVTQVGLPIWEGNGALCPAVAPAPGSPVAEVPFNTRALCGPVAGSVTRGQRYVLTLRIADAWKDGSFPATPAGLTAGELPFPIGYLGVPLRRVVNAGFLQPAYLIRSPRRWWQWRTPIFIEPLHFTLGADGAQWCASFVAPRDGALFFFANDAVPPFGPLDAFYARGRGRNTGRATIGISPAGPPGQPPRDPGACVAPIVTDD